MGDVGGGVGRRGTFPSSMISGLEEKDETERYLRERGSIRARDEGGECVSDQLWGSVYAQSEGVCYRCIENELPTFVLGYRGQNPTKKQDKKRPPEWGLKVRTERGKVRGGRWELPKQNGVFLL